MTSYNQFGLWELKAQRGQEELPAPAKALGQVIVIPGCAEIGSLMRSGTLRWSSMWRTQTPIAALKSGLERASLSMSLSLVSIARTPSKQFG